MDQLLTREQAEWLIENIKPSLSSTASSLMGVISFDDLRNFIYKHCIKEDLIIESLSGGGLIVSKRADSIALCMSQRDDKGNARHMWNYFKHEEMYKIIKWLEDNYE
jgi:hypothetical protein